MYNTRLEGAYIDFLYRGNRRNSAPLDHITDQSAIGCSLPSRNSHIFTWECLWDKEETVLFRRQYIWKIKPVKERVEKGVDDP